MQRPNIASFLGTHVILDIWSEDHSLYKSSELMSNMLEEAAKKTGATVLSKDFHEFGEDSGITGVLVLAESHISVHAFPEENYAAFDIFVCYQCDPRKAIDHIVEATKAYRHETNIILC